MSRINRLKKRWKKLKYWQKGAIIGGGLHVGIVFLIVLVAVIFVPRTSPPGSGDMGPASAWLLFILYGVVEFPPSWILSLTTGIEGVAEPSLKNWFWIFFLIYATLFYSLMGIIIAKLIELPNKSDNVRNKDVAPRGKK